jgi:hypothetical protein
MGWISIRNEWPQAPGKYKVLDCRTETQTKLHYDGFEFAKYKLVYLNDVTNETKKFEITHWKEIKDKKMEEMRQRIALQKIEIENM